MATSGTFTGARVGTSPNLILDWLVLEQDVANNRSKVRLILKCYSQYAVNFSATKYGVLDGTSFSYSGGMSGTNITITLYTKEAWYSHDAEGNLTKNFAASFNINISWGGSNLPTLYVSGDAILDTIPRASTLDSFSIANQLAYNTTNSVNLQITRASSTFTHDITLLLGSYVVVSWTGQGVPTSLALTAGQINEILTRTSATETAVLTLTIQTKSGSTNIGNTVSAQYSAAIAASVAPVASGLTISISGTGRDNVIGKYVQSISKVAANFSSSPGYGANITSTSIVIRRDSDKANSQTIPGASGTIANPVALSGLYEVIATVTDSRGRSATQRVTFMVHAYIAPQISAFTAVRSVIDETIVILNRSGSYTPLDAGDNNLTITIQKKVAGGSYVAVGDPVIVTTPTFAGSVNSIENSIATSYEFLLIITDSFGKSAPFVRTVSASKVVLAIKKNEAVGIGVIPETGAGVLDIGGQTTIRSGGLGVNKIAANGGLDVDGPSQLGGDTNVLGDLSVSGINILSSLAQVLNKGYGAGTIISRTLQNRSVFVLFTGAAAATIGLFLISTDASAAYVHTLKSASGVTASVSGFNLTVTSTYSVAYGLLKLN